MIAKHVRIRQPKAGRFGRLIEYLLDPQEKSERVGKITATNCYSDDPARAVLEVMNTQAQNVRAKSDKSYHLVLSFAPGENPPEATLAAIEQSIVECLGYAEHQRVSVVHHDTDHLHIHIAINKIHPRRHTIHEPIRDYYTLATLCEELEKKHGLQITNHESQTQRLGRGAAEMETRSQRESFTTWVRRECAPALGAASSWEEWHTIAAASGLTTRKRGNGLVIESAGGLAIKASSIDRAFSLAALEKRFGAFSDAETRRARPERRYEPKPVQTDTTALYARYQRERFEHAEALSRHRERLRAAKRAAIGRAQRIHSERRRRLRLLPRSHGKRLLVREIVRVHRRRLDGIFAQAKEARHLMSETYGRLAWGDWLARQAANGDVQALLALRTRARSQEYQYSVSAGAGHASTHPEPLTAPHAGVTKRGSIFVRPGIRDEGHRVSIQANRHIHDYVALLNLAVTRYGRHLRADGDERFQTQIVLAAVVSRLNVTFEDAALERRREHLATLMESMNERKGHHGRGTNRGGPGRAREATELRTPELAGGRAATHYDPPRTVARTDLDGARPVPIAQSLDRLRNLSALPVVRGADGTALLLPTHVQHHLGQRGASAAEPLRRTLSPTPLTDQARDGWSKADRYIAERMEKRLILSDIPKHKRHEQTGLYPFAGLRSVSGQSLALFKTESGVSVLPVSNYAAKRLRSVPLDKPVHVSAKGVRLGRSL